MKVAIIADWLVGGGAELVVLELHKMFPEAPIYTSYATSEWRQKLDNKVITGWLQRWPFSKLRKFTPFLRAWWFYSLKFNGYDLVISSSGAEAKGIKTKKPTMHINYCHAPTHYYWNRYEEYLKSPGFGLFDGLARLGLKLLVGPMRRWDKKAAQRPDFMLANSNYTRSQIKKYYERDSVVIYPPIDTKRFDIKPPVARQGFVTMGRQTPYKRIDLAVAACTELNLPLTVIGDGPDHSKLQKMAGPSIKFLGYVPNAKTPIELSQAQGFIFPNLDDFGISAVEALAAGTPVIAYKAGGALDYVLEGKTGLFFENQTVDSLVKALQKFDASKFNSSEIKNHAEQLDTRHFHQKMADFISSISSN